MDLPVFQERNAVNRSCSRTRENSDCHGDAVRSLTTSATKRWSAVILVVIGLLNPTVAEAQDAASKSAAVSQQVLTLLRAEEMSKALETIAPTVDQSATINGLDVGLSAAAGGLSRSLSELSTDEQYDLLHKWSMPSAERPGIRVLTSLVPEVAPPMEFARALGQRPKKESFAISTIGPMPGIFCSAWSMILAADDSGNLRKLMTELEGLAAKKTPNADSVLLLAKIRDTRSTDDDLKTLLAARVAPADAATPSMATDTVLVAAAMKRPPLGEVCEQIAERLNQFDFAQGTSASVPFLRRLRATVILKNRSPETAPETVLYTPPQLWIAADDQRLRSSTGSDSAIWLTHEEHIKRLAGPGDDLLLFRYPLVGTFELKGEATSLDHGGAGMTYGGLGFDANAQRFALREVQRSHEETRVWPFVAPPELRMFNRVNIRSDGQKVTFLSNLHPGWSGSAASCASCPWLGLRAFGDGRAYFRNLELVGEPQIPREVRIADSADLRGWTATYGESVPTAVQPFLAAGAADAAQDDSKDWHVADSVIYGRAADGADTKSVNQSHLAYMRPLLDGETIAYEFFYEDGKTTVHPVLGRLAFLMEPDGVRMHWLTDTGNEWTGLPEDNTVIEPLNRRGAKSLPLKAKDWNSVTLKLSGGKVNVTLNGEGIYERPLDDIHGRHPGFYHDRNKTTAQIRNVVLTGDWPEKLSAEQLAKLVALE